MRWPYNSPSFQFTELLHRRSRKSLNGLSLTASIPSLLQQPLHAHQRISHKFLTCLTLRIVRPKHMPVALIQFEPRQHPRLPQDAIIHGCLIPQRIKASNLKKRFRRSFMSSWVIERIPQWTVRFRSVYLFDETWRDFLEYGVTPRLSARFI
jgi:hypothetical protein